MTREIDLSKQLEKTQVEASETKDRLQRRIVVRIILIYIKKQHRWRIEIYDLLYEDRRTASRAQMNEILIHLQFVL